MKAPKAKAKSTMKKVLKRPAAALPDPEQKANAKEDCQGDGRRMQEDRDEPVPDDYAEGEKEEPKEEDAIVADDWHRSLS